MKKTITFLLLISLSAFCQGLPNNIIGSYYVGGGSNVGQMVGEKYDGTLKSIFTIEDSTKFTFNVDNVSSDGITAAKAKVSTPSYLVGFGSTNNILYAYPTGSIGVPPQSGHNGKALFTNGTVASWQPLATVATTGSYIDLINKPTLFSGSYTDLSNKPTIPTTTSQLTNNSGFLTAEVDGSPTNEIELPTQTGQSGKVLTTNGTAPSWANVVDAGTVTTSGVALQTVYTITHSLGYTPSRIIIQAKTAAAAEKSYITNITATNFQVVFLTVPILGTNNITLDWFAFK